MINRHELFKLWPAEAVEMIEKLEESVSMHQYSLRITSELRSAIIDGAADWKLGELARTLLSAIDIESIASLADNRTELKANALECKVRAQFTTIKESKMRKPTKNEIDDVLDWCVEAEETGTKYGGMTYEQGVRAAIDWMQGHGENPKD